MEISKLNNLNSKLFIITGILSSFNFFYVLRAENITDRFQVSLITFAPVLLALILFSIKRIFNNKLTRLPTVLFTFTANISTLLLYLYFAINTQLFTTVEGWMSSSLYLLVLPIYSGITSLVVSISTFLVLLISQLYNKRCIFH
jgi:formate hydrogenlyase subunit 3/multisubunit Na+/H+ antiporter MnhD subunit